MATVALSAFSSRGYTPGRSRLMQAIWFFIGAPLLRCHLIPISAVRRAILTAFGATIGRGLVIKPGVRVKYPWLLQVGNHCWIGEDCWIDNIAPTVLSDDVCISQGVYVCTGNHDWSDPAFRLMVQPVRFEKGSWVGAKAVVGPGTTIGECAVVTAGSVVNGSVPPYEIHAGNPARFVRKREIREPIEHRAASCAVGI